MKKYEVKFLEVVIKELKKLDKLIVIMIKLWVI